MANTYFTTLLETLCKETDVIMRKKKKILQKAYGARIKGIHFINAPSFIDHIVTLVKSAIKPKLTARVMLYTHFDRFKIVDTNLLSSLFQNVKVK